jgi:hypothetical protein
MMMMMQVKLFVVLCIFVSLGACVSPHHARPHQALVDSAQRSEAVSIEWHHTNLIAMNNIIFNSLHTFHHSYLSPIHCKIHS